MLRLVIGVVAAGAVAIATASPVTYSEPSEAAMKQQKSVIESEGRKAEAYYEGQDFATLIGKERKKIEQVKPLLPNKLELPEELKNQQWAGAFDQVEIAAGEMPKDAPGVNYGPLVFASLSVNKESLKLIAADAQKGQGAVVFRGVKNDDFRAMRAELAGMGEGFVIDPTLFIRFGITEVPTIVLPLEPVVPCEPDGCPAIAFVKVAGNVTVAAAMDFIQINSAQPKARALAKEILKRIEQ